MTLFREILDPHNTLPSVMLDTIVTRDLGDLRTELIDIRTDDRKVGTLELVSEVTEGSRFAHIDGIEIHNQLYLGRGVGLAAYILAIERSHADGYDFETQNSILSRHSKKVWEHLAHNAVAEVVVPFRPSTRVGGYYEGKYRVPYQPTKNPL